MSVTAKKVLDIMRGWVERKESDGSHKPIIDIHNAHRPLASGYARPKYAAAGNADKKPDKNPSTQMPENQT